MIFEALKGLMKRAAKPLCQGLFSSPGGGERQLEAAIMSTDFVLRYYANPNFWRRRFSPTLGTLVQARGLRKLQLQRRVCIADASPSPSPWRSDPPGRPYCDRWS